MDRTFKSHQEAHAYLIGLGYVWSHEGLGGDTRRDYYRRTDGKPEAMYDHSATLTIYREKTFASIFGN